MAGFETEQVEPRGGSSLLLALVLIGMIAVSVWFFVMVRELASAGDAAGTAFPAVPGAEVRDDVADDGVAPALLLPAAGGETTYEA